MTDKNISGFIKILNINPYNSIRYGSIISQNRCEFLLWNDVFYLKGKFILVDHKLKKTETGIASGIFWWSECLSGYPIVFMNLIDLIDMGIRI